MDDLQQLLAEAFAAELAEHLAAIRTGLAAAGAGGSPDLRDIFRRAHSLKGAARAVDREDVEALAHTLESLLAEVEQGRRALDAGAVSEARALLDAIEDATAAAPPEAAWGRTAAGTAEGVAELASPGHLPEARPPEARPAPDEAASLEIIRIPGRRIERLAEAVRALEGDLEARAAAGEDWRAARAEIEAIRDHCLRSDAQLPDIAARLTRLLAATLAGAAGQATADSQIDRAAARLGREAQQILLAPAALLADGQERAVRTLAADAGKKAELVLRCDSVEADRGVLQSLREPLVHLIRNAVGHGVESPAQRLRAGKPECAAITLEVRERDGQLLVAVEDDGPGPDAAAIVAAARARGLAAAGSLDEEMPDEAAALALVFEHGVSTSAAVDRLSGRGVGLAAVSTVARRLHGAARMLRAPAGGTRIELTVPLTATRRTLLLVEAAGQLYAVPTRAAGRAIRFPAARIEMRGGLPVLRDGAPLDTGPRDTGPRGDRLLPLVSLAALLDLPAEAPGEEVEAFVLHAAGRECLVTVDALRDVRTLALRDAAEIAADVPLVLGIALVESRGDGQAGRGGLAIVLSPEALAERAARGGAAIAARARPAERRRQPTILVVDDSITTRTLERGILEGHGYRVLLSVDGVDGLAALRAGAGAIDLVVTDVEMPRMDGFGLLAAVRNDSALADIPVIIMTSRNSPDDIQRGLDLGANAYVTKQEFDQGSLLATVGRLI